MTRRKGLEARVRRRPLGVWPFHNIVRAELERVARKVRKLPTTRGMYYDQATCVKLKDVLAILREAQR